jgi:hypothetical protein
MGLPSPADPKARQAKSMGRCEFLLFRSWSRRVVSLMQAEEGQDKHDDDDQTDEVDYSVHANLRR